MGELPSGPLWEAYKTAIALNNTMLRIAAFPPGTPKAAVEDIRAALQRMSADPAFVAESTRTFGYVPEIISGAEVPEQIRQALSVSPQMRTWVTDYIKAGELRK